ncbi:PASTA domain-containing protein [Nocardioides stalactiti]|uniref:PASTA domain-containing protein n=1 Tax=Nocardioides stalactiti TaxID=2755356 RepID=UPI001601E6F8|nr:PASTA domain-containing protein [Nocardioides stalactiti]
MTDPDHNEPALADLLDRSAARVVVGPAPVTAMVDGADRLRRRRTTTRVAATALAVGVVVGGTALATRPGDGPGRPARPDLPAASTTPDPAPDVVPPGTRLVGIGQSAIAVPETWATNALRCGTAERPTVVIDVGAIESCLWLGAPVFDNVWIDRGVNEEMFAPAATVEIDGVTAERDEITCTEPQTQGGTRVPRRCSGTVHLPSEDASYRAEAATRKRVEEILSWIRIVPDRVAVPGLGSRNGADYRRRLEAAGLRIETVTEKRPAFPTDFVLEVEPGPGTLLVPGDPVTITTVAAPEGPADEVAVDVNSSDPGGDYRGLTDAEVRAGATIRLEVGSTIWAYGHGKRIGTLAGEVSGPSLVLDDWEEGPNYGRSWNATVPGTNTIRLTIEADGRRIEIGTITVVVR